jgi:putative methionine-R-sulfoxide reductase with GAF domain
MDRYSILDQSLSQAGPDPALTDRTAEESVPPLPEDSHDALRLRFPGDDGGKSLNSMAQRDLDATLQLLAERAQYITGASGAAIALREGEEMICRASSGESAPELGAHLQVDSGLSGESVRTKKILRCDDAESDTRVNQESCRALGIASVVVMPLIREQEVNGVFELLSGTAYAFEERDLGALERLAEMIQTALEHAEAAKRVETVIAGAPGKAASEPLSGVESKVKVESDRVRKTPNEDENDAVPQPTAETKTAAVPTEAPSSANDEQAKTGGSAESFLPNELGNIGKCATCGFPISEGRKLCLDCEADQIPESVTVAAPENRVEINDAPEFLSNLAVPENESWLKSHLYMIATMALVAATVILIIWRSL